MNLPTVAQARTEILSGLTVALALVPEAVAFAFVAGVEPLVGLYAAFFVGIITAVFGGRPGMISGATGALAVVMVALVADHGVASFKIFLAYKGALDIADSNLIPLLELARELGVIVTAHCENAEAIDAMQRRLLADGKTGPEWHEPSRPRSVEASGVNHLCTFAELTGAHVYIVHTSCEASLQQATAARARGVNVWVESVIPHLVLDHTPAERPGFEGAKYVMSPPLRDAEEHGPL